MPEPGIERGADGIPDGSDEPDAGDSAGDDSAGAESALKLTSPESSWRDDGIITSLDMLPLEERAGAATPRRVLEGPLALELGALGALDTGPVMGVICANRAKSWRLLRSRSRCS